MHRPRTSRLALPLAFMAAMGAQTAPAQSSERKALDFLAREVPLWSLENHCYSCHNNGDAARALYDAKRRRQTIPNAALADTSLWLSRPERWDRNGGQGPFSDKTLARIQFASALALATTSGAIADRTPLKTAAARLAQDQAADGSWPLAEGAGNLGSPASYGKPLATLAARDTLRAADPFKYANAIARAESWLLARPLKTMIDASIVLNISPLASNRSRAWKMVREAQAPDGGWGPFADTPTEPFDSALVLLALARLDPTPETRAMIRRARSYLEAAQLPDGSWPETTRPPNALSYAQKLSTTAWSTLALLATTEPDAPR